MVFSSIEFIYLFLPVAVGGYFLCPRRLKNLWLFAVSLFFYAYGEPIYVFLMLLAALFCYLFGRAIESRPRYRRLYLMLASAFFIGILVFFKYYSLICKILPLKELDIPLPIGISFYTFQALSYVVDVYRGDTRAEKDFISFGAYLSLFPQLIAGPIVKYTQVSSELSERQHSPRKTASGVGRFCVGLAKKVILANGAGALADRVFAEKNMLSFILWLVLFALQIYYDFSGYSDMAIGLGRIFGFEFPENFNYPYISESITDFWRRWHMTLSGWFREYIYIPLGGNRRGRWRTILNLFVVWSLTGLWHGAQVNFLLWGIYFFFILTLEKYLLKKYLVALPKLLRRIYALCLILVGWAIFAADRLDMTILSEFLSSPLADGRTVYLLLRNILFILIMLVGVTPLPRKAFEKLCSRFPTGGGVAGAIASILSLILSTAYIAASSYDPFLYFRF